MANDPENSTASNSGTLSLEDFIKLGSKKGGEQSDEDALKDKPKAYSQSYAGREAYQQGQPTAQAGVQADGMLRSEDQGQRQRNDQADLTLEQFKSLGSKSKGTVPPPPEDFVGQLQTEAGKKAGIATLIEEGVKMTSGTIAAALAVPESVAETMATGGVGALAVPAIEMFAFKGGYELADKALIKPVESLLGIKKGIEEAKKAAPKVTTAAGYVSMLPFLAKSAVGYTKAGIEAAEKAGAEKATSAATKAVLQRAGAGAVGGLAFEPVRYGVEAGEKAFGITDEAPASITLESLGESALTGGLLGGGGFKTEAERAKEALKKLDKENQKKKAGMDQISAAGLPETSKVAGAAKTDKAIQESEELTPEKKREKFWAEREAKTKAKKESPAEEAVPEEPTAPRIASAAWRNPRTGEVFYAVSHQDAVEKARQAAQDPEQKDKVVAADLPKQDVSVPSNRETPDFGFLTTDGQFLSRQEAEQLAIQTGQFKGKTTDRPVMHSNEVQQDYHPETGPKRYAEAGGEKFPGAASAREFSEDRLTQAAEAIYETESQNGSGIDVNNEGDKRAWQANLNKRFDLGTFSLEEMNSLWNQSHEAYRIRKASGDTIPIERAVQQIGGKRIQSQERISTTNALLNESLQKQGRDPLVMGRKITETETWQKGARLLADDPQFIYNLKDEFKKKARSLTPEETMAVAQHIGDTENKITSLSDQRAEEVDPEKLKSLDAQLDRLKDELSDVANLYRKAGTETSASLRLRAIQAAADFSVGRLVTDRERALKRKLTKEELIETQKEAKEIEAKQKEAEDLANKANANRQEGEIENIKRDAVKRRKEINAEDLIKTHLQKIKENPRKSKEDHERLADSVREVFRGVNKLMLDRATSLKGDELNAKEAEAATPVREATQRTHDIVKGVLGEGWDLKQTRDAISHYGIFTKANSDALSLAVTRGIGVNRAIGKIESIVNDLIAPLRTGQQRPKPSAEQRMKDRRVNQLLKKFNIRVTDPETQLQGQIDANFRRLENRREELETIYAKGRPLTEELRNEIYREHPELNDLRGEIIGLQKMIEDKYGKREVLMEKKVAALERIYDNLIKRYEREIASGEIAKTTSKGEKLTSEKLEAQRETLANLRAERQAIRDADAVRQEEKRYNQLSTKLKDLQRQLDQGFLDEKKKKTPATSERIKTLEKQIEDVRSKMMSEDWFKSAKEAIALQSYKTRVGHQIEEAKRRLATGDFTKAERRETKLDEEARKKKTELQELKDKIRQKIALEEWKNRTPWEKAIDVTLKAKRAAVLSFVSTITKLGASSFEIPLLRVPSYLAGKVLTKTGLLSDIAAKSRQEYGSDVLPEIKTYARGLWDGVREVKDIAFKLKRSQLDLEYGDTSLIPLGALDMPGKIHEAIKNPTKLANYKIAYERYMEWAAREGWDIKSDEVKQAAGVEAYKSANESIFLQDNGLVDKYNLFVTTLQKSSSKSQRSLGAFLQFNLPIIRIPANIVKEAFEYQFGLIPGVSKAISRKLSKEVGKRVEDLSPEEADLIMKQIKKGSVGALGLVLGFAMPELFGGFYQKGKDKDEEGPEYGGIQIGGVKIPKTVLHHPAFVPLQIGATIRKNVDEVINEGDFGEDTKAIITGSGAAIMGLVEELPFVNFNRNIGKYTDMSRLPVTAGEFTKSMIPGVIQEVAKVMDTDELSARETLKTLFWSKEDVTKRQAETFLDSVMEGVPILRQQVPEK